MKKISYFGKEYTVSNDVKWVATSECGNVLAFTDEPWMLGRTWIANGDIGSRIDIWGITTKDWKNSLRKVEDILVREEHPHADLILKYAMIAQYDAEPWKHFEYETSTGWTPCLSMAAFNENVNYRLKPQPPAAQVGQIWVSKEGVEVMIDTPSHEKTIYFSFDVCGYNYKNCVTIAEFLKNFKRKE